MGAKVKSHRKHISLSSSQEAPLSTDHSTDQSQEIPSKIPKLSRIQPDYELIDTVPAPDVNLIFNPPSSVFLEELCSLFDYNCGSL